MADHLDDIDLNSETLLAPDYERHGSFSRSESICELDGIPPTIPSILHPLYSSFISLLSFQNLLLLQYLENYVEPDAMPLLIESHIRTPLKDEIQQTFINNPRIDLMLVLGATGSGKTLCARLTQKRLWEQLSTANHTDAEDDTTHQTLRNNMSSTSSISCNIPASSFSSSCSSSSSSSSWVPLYFEVRSMSGKSSLVERLQAEPYRYSAAHILQLQHNYKFVIILDGWDQYVPCSDGSGGHGSTTASSAVEQAYIGLQLWNWHAKVIITCTTEFWSKQFHVHVQQNQSSPSQQQQQQQYPPPLHQNQREDNNNNNNKRTTETSMLGSGTANNDSTGIRKPGGFSSSSSSSSYYNTLRRGMVQPIKDVCQEEESTGDGGDDDDLDQGDKDANAGGAAAAGGVGGDSGEICGSDYHLPRPNEQQQKQQQSTFSMCQCQCAPFTPYQIEQYLKKRFPIDDDEGVSEDEEDDDEESIGGDGLDPNDTVAGKVNKAEAKTSAGGRRAGIGSRQTWRIYEEFIYRSEYLAALASSPVLLHSICSLLPVFHMNIAIGNKDMTQCEVIELLLNAWCETEIIGPMRMVEEVSLRRESSIKNSFAFYLDRLAYHMYRTGVSAAETLYAPEQLKAAGKSDPWADFFDNPKTLSVQKSCPLAVDRREIISKEGVERRSHRYHFIHRIFLEHCAARWLWNALKSPKNTMHDRINMWNARYVTEERGVMHFLVEQLVNSENRALEEIHLLEMVYASKQTPEYSKAASSAISVLNKAGFDFHNMILSRDLKQVCIPFADLTSAKLPCMDLSGSDLSYVCFREALLTSARLVGANLEGTRFAPTCYSLKCKRVVESLSVVPAHLSPGKTLVAFTTGNEIIVSRPSEDHIYARSGTTSYTEIDLNGNRAIVNKDDGGQAVCGDLSKFKEKKNEKDTATAAALNHIEQLTFSIDGLLASCTRQGFVKLSIIPCLFEGLKQSRSSSSRTTFSLSASVNSSTDETVPGSSVNHSTDETVPGEIVGIRTFTGHVGTANCVAFSSCGELLASGGEDATIRLWPTGTVAEAVKQRLHSYANNNNNMTDTNSVRLGNHEEEVDTYTLTADRDDEESYPVQVLTGHASKVTSVCFAPSSCSVGSICGRGTGNNRVLSVLASGSKDTTIRVWHGCLRDTRRAPRGNNKEQSREYRLWYSCAHVLDAHSDSITCVTFSCNGLLASAGEGRTIRIWAQQQQQHQEQQPQQPQPHSHPEPQELHKLSISLDLEQGAAEKNEKGKEEAEKERTSSSYTSTSTSSLSSLWTCTHSMRRHAYCVYTLAFSPDGCVLASGSKDSTIRLWDVNTKSNTPSPTINTGRRSSVETRDNSTSTTKNSSLELQGDGGEGVRDSRGSAVTERETLSQQQQQQHQTPPPRQEMCLRTLTEHAASVKCLCFSSTGRLFSGSRDRSIRTWELSLLDPASTSLEAGTVGGLTRVGFTVAPAATTKGSSSSSAANISATKSDGKSELRSATHTAAVSCLVHSKDGDILASGSHDCTIMLWKTGLGPKNGCCGILRGHTDIVKCLAFSADEGPLLLASGGSDTSVRLWDVKNKRCTMVLQAHYKMVSCLAFSPRGLLASGGWDNMICLWDARTTQARSACKKLLIRHASSISCVSFSPNGHMLASADHSATIVLWSVRSPTNAAPLKCYYSVGGAPSSSSFSSSSQLNSNKHYYYSSMVFVSNSMLATGGEDSTLRLWNTRRLDVDTCLFILNGHSAAIKSVSISHDGHKLASSSKNEILLWDSSALETAPLKLPFGTTCVSVHRNCIGMVHGASVHVIELLHAIRKKPFRWTMAAPPVLWAQGCVVSDSRGLSDSAKRFLSRSGAILGSEVAATTTTTMAVLTDESSSDHIRNSSTDGSSKNNNYKPSSADTTTVAAATTNRRFTELPPEDGALSRVHATIDMVLVDDSSNSANINGGTSGGVGVGVGAYTNTNTNNTNASTSADDDVKQQCIAQERSSTAASATDNDRCVSSRNISITSFESVNRMHPSYPAPPIPAASANGAPEDTVSSISSQIVPLKAQCGGASSSTEGGAKGSGGRRRDDALPLPSAGGAAGGGAAACAPCPALSQFFDDEEQQIGSSNSGSSELDQDELIRRANAAAVEFMSAATAAVAVDVKNSRSNCRHHTVDLMDTVHVSVDALKEIMRTTEQIPPLSSELTPDMNDDEDEDEDVEKEKDYWEGEGEGLDSRYSSDSENNNDINQEDDVLLLPGGVVTSDSQLSAAGAGSSSSADSHPHNASMAQTNLLTPEASTAAVVTTVDAITADATSTATSSRQPSVNDLVEQAQNKTRTAWIHYKKGEFSASRNTALESLALFRLAYGAEANHPYIANVLNSLGQICRASGANSTALEFYAQSLEMMQALYGKDAAHSDILETLCYLAAMYKEHDENELTRVYYEQALEMSYRLPENSCDERIEFIEDQLAILDQMRGNVVSSSVSTAEANKNCVIS